MLEFTKVLRRLLEDGRKAKSAFTVKGKLLCQEMKK